MLKFFFSKLYYKHEIECAGFHNVLALWHHRMLVLGTAECRSSYFHFSWKQNIFLKMVPQDMEVCSGQNSLFLLPTFYSFRFMTGIIFICSLN